jgi:hypothetical protein
MKVSHPKIVQNMFYLSSELSAPPNPNIDQVLARKEKRRVRSFATCIFLPGGLLQKSNMILKSMCDSDYSTWHIELVLFEYTIQPFYLDHVQHLFACANALEHWNDHLGGP